MWKCPKCGKRVDDAYEICWACGTSTDGVENPHFLDENHVETAPDELEEQIPPESLVTLIKCSLAPEAHAIRVRLESEGIPVFLFDEFTITMDWLLSNAIGGVKVQVPEPYLEKAQAILGIVEEEQQAEDEEEEEHDEDDESFGDETDEESGQEPDERIADLEKSPPVNNDDRIVDKQDGAD